MNENVLRAGLLATATSVVSANSLRRLASTLASVVGSSAEVVSSSSNTCGWRTSARARAMRWR